MKKLFKHIALITLIALLLIPNIKPVSAVSVGNDVDYIPPPRNVGIGVIDPDAKLEVNGQVMITGGNPEADAVLTSDANGKAHWQKVNLSSIDNDLVVNGAVSANHFVGNGAGLTNINAANVENATTANTADFATIAGSATSATNISPGGIINGAALLNNDLNGTLTLLAEAEILGDLTLNGELTADKFIGDGSMLTGLIAAANVANATTANTADFATTAGSATTATNLSGGAITNASSAQINGPLEAKVFGLGESTDSISAAGGVTVANSYIRIQGNGGAVDITKNPQITLGTVPGQVLIIRGLSDTNTVKFDDGDGLVLDGGASFTLGNKDVITFVYDASDSIWIETGRIDR